MVDQDRSLGGDLHRLGQVLPEHLLVVHFFHRAPPQDVRWADHQRVPDRSGDGERLFEGARHPRLRLGDSQPGDDLAEPVPVLGEVDRRRGGAEDPDPCRLEFSCEVEGRLAAELHDHPLGLLLFVDREHVLDGQGLEIELVGGVVIRGDGLGIAVDHDRFVPRLAEGEGGVDAAVVEFDPLPDPVRTAAENEDLPPVARLDPVRPVVGRVVVGGLLHSAHRDRVPCLHDPQRDPSLPDRRFRDAEDIGEVFVGEPVLFRLDEEVVGGKTPLVYE
jgi:hypothetical protein